MRIVCLVLWFGLNVDRLMGMASLTRFFSGSKAGETDIEGSKANFKLPVSKLHKLGEYEQKLRSKFQPFGWYNKQVKNRQVDAALNEEDSTGTIRAFKKRSALEYLSDEELCVDEFFGIRYFDQSFLKDVLEKLEYDVCSQPAGDYTDLQYDVRPILDCSNGKWLRLDCEFRTPDMPKDEYFYASRIGRKSTASKLARAANKLLSGESNEARFGNRILCGDSGDIGDQKKECDDLLNSFVKIEALFKEKADIKEGVRSGRINPNNLRPNTHAPPTPKQEADSDSPEKIIMIVGGVIVAVGIAIGVFVMVKRSKKKAQAPSPDKEIPSSGVDSEEALISPRKHKKPKRKPKQPAPVDA